jgi:hypothetical protein
MPLSLPLPDERAWVFDKAPPGQAHGVHRPSGASLWVWEFFERELVNRSKCEALALQRGYGPVGALRSAHRQVLQAPAEFDTGLWVVLAEGTGAQPWKGGHAFAFAAQRRKCLVLRYDAPVSAAQEEGSLFADLARMESFGFPALAVDNPMDGPPRENQPTLRSMPRRDARDSRDLRTGVPSAP